MCPIDRSPHGGEILHELPECRDPEPEPDPVVDSGPGIADGIHSLRRQRG